MKIFIVMRPASLTLRNQILHHAKDPISAADLARQLGLPRQRVNYHVQALARAGLLHPAVRQKKRNMLEQKYIAASPARDLGTICARVQVELAAAVEAAARAGLRIRTFALHEEVRFGSAQDRVDFLNALEAAVAELIEEYASPGGSSFRLVLGCYPAM